MSSQKPDNKKQPPKDQYHGILMNSVTVTHNRKKVFISVHRHRKPTAKIKGHRWKSIINTEKSETTKDISEPLT